MLNFKEPSKQPKDSYYRYKSIKHSKMSIHLQRLTDFDVPLTKHIPEETNLKLFLLFAYLRYLLAVSEANENPTSFW